MKRTEHGCTNGCTDSPDFVARLTSRHLEIARVLWEGYPRKVVRIKLGLSETSVRNEINRIADVLELDRSKSIDAQIIRWEERRREASIAA